jgi:hypothetical protein
MSSMLPAHAQKKHLSFDALRSSLSNCFTLIQDDRVQGRCQHTLHDAMMSAFACMFFQDASIAEFQRQVQEGKNTNNLNTLFHVQTIPKDTQLRDVVDNVSSEALRPIFKDYFHQLQRAKQLEPLQVLPNLYLCAIDGVYHHSSEQVHCEQCLTKKHKNGSVTYSHGVLQGAFMHPEQRQVIPVMPEPIANSEGGYLKQDCEINAAKRFITHLKKDHPRLGMLITGDGLFSKAPMVNLVLEHKMHFIFVAKPDDHKYMMQWIAAYDHLPEISVNDSRGRVHRYTYQNQVPLNAKEDAPLVNYIHYELNNEKGKVTYRNSWVTDIVIEKNNVAKLAKAGRCRWKIENECFNTLKNQGYHLNHNFGHGKKNLSHNMYLLTLLAFFFHQIFELSDPAYQLCRKSYVNKMVLWETFRTLIIYFIFDTWNDAFSKLLEGRANAKVHQKNK